jgi:hypothetical protein
MKQALMIGAVLVTSLAAQAKTATVTINKIDENGVGSMLGVIQLEDTKDGLRLTPSLNGLPPGQHGLCTLTAIAVPPTTKASRLPAWLPEDTWTPTIAASIWDPKALKATWGICPPSRSMTKGPRQRQ